ncbi:MAG: hypothetical protein NT154_08340 [Verrucomicrobia bacterium]|nr:hypothetical protein [Verrucomicrobiota bacterium]
MTPTFLGSNNSPFTQVGAGYGRETGWEEWLGWMAAEFVSMAFLLLHSLRWVESQHAGACGTHAVIDSFPLFGLGTLAALTKHR